MSPDAKTLHDKLKGREDVRWADVRDALKTSDPKRISIAWKELRQTGLAEGPSNVCRDVQRVHACEHLALF
jgi:hypothetical protein